MTLGIRRSPARGGAGLRWSRFGHGAGDGGRTGFRRYALSFDYGQRHRAELVAAARVAQTLGAVEHRTMVIDFAGIGGSALTDPAIDVPEQASRGSR